MEFVFTKKAFITHYGAQRVDPPIDEDSPELTQLPLLHQELVI